MCTLCEKPFLLFPQNRPIRPYFLIFEPNLSLAQQNTQIIIFELGYVLHQYRDDRQSNISFTDLASLGKGFPITQELECRSGLKTECL